MNKILSFLLLLSSLVNSNEISFYEIKDSDDQSFEISFLLDKVSFIKSYSLVDPSRIVIDVYQSDLKSDVEEKYNYPIKLVRASSKDDLTRIVIDLYEYVNWSKPTQEKTDEGILLSKLGINYNTLKIRPPMTFTKANVDYLIEKLDKVLDKYQLNA